MMDTLNEFQWLLVGWGYFIPLILLTIILWIIVKITRRAERKKHPETTDEVTGSDVKTDEDKLFKPDKKKAIYINGYIAGYAFKQKQDESGFHFYEY